jgi:hypothetical protein
VAEVGVGWALLLPVGVRFVDMDGDGDGDEREEAAPLVCMPEGGGRLILVVFRLWVGTGIAVAVATGAMMAAWAATALSSRQGI